MVGPRVVLVFEVKILFSLVGRKALKFINTFQTIYFKKIILDLKVTDENTKVFNENKLPEHWFEVGLVLMDVLLNKFSPLEFYDDGCITICTNLVLNSFNLD